MPGEVAQLTPEDTRSVVWSPAREEHVVNGDAARLAAWCEDFDARMEKALAPWGFYTVVIDTCRSLTITAKPGTRIQVLAWRACVREGHEKARSMILFPRVAMRRDEEPDRRLSDWANISKGLHPRMGIGWRACAEGAFLSSMVATFRLTAKDESGQPLEVLPELAVWTREVRDAVADAG